MFADLPFLRAGFRPFFLFAGLFAMLHIPVWLALMTGQATVPLAFDPMLWHGHEMLFGFGAATVAGFLLTAVPNAQIVEYVPRSAQLLKAMPAMDGPDMVVPPGPGFGLELDRDAVQRFTVTN